MAEDIVSVARRAYRAYVDKDRAAIEAVIGDPFTFTSPLDNGIDRQTYFERCWPNSERISAFRFVHLVQDGERVFVTYEGTSTGGQGFRNTEILTIRNGRIVATEVYFGWSLPHAAPEAGFVGSAADRGSEGGEGRPR